MVVGGGEFLATQLMVKIKVYFLRLFFPLGHKSMFAIKQDSGQESAAISWQPVKSVEQQALSVA